ncbi:PREDICTED: AT-hook motif nuclear-localized protein 4-like isoform X3 [Ipomoea nil]|nr:PREDICTED: AT-hook motif nuclear-localized protein 4-like isoform X3 [Ipomoea nil]XP_019193298.1 PREDICTED: AT-hook motif nuclear-localized protein 4-like isoform X3 [Ipomoea nil]
MELPRRRRRRRSSGQTTGGPEPPSPTRIVQDILSINAGEDVVQTILAHFRNIPRPSQEYLGVVLSATGSVLNPAISTRLLTKSFEGAFPIAHLTGHFIIKRTGRVEPRQGLNITFRGSDGEMVGGRVEGSLIAATKIQLCVGRFPHEAN